VSPQPEGALTGVTDVVVVGGGISGLTAAYRLAQKSIPFRLLEASPRLGGVIRTERQDGFLLEGGPDAILAQKSHGLALCEEIGLGPRLVPTNSEHRTVFVLHRGRLHPLPEGMVLAVPTRIGPFLRSGLFSWRGKLRLGLDLVRPARRATGDESIAAFLRRRFGQEAVDRLGEPLLAGIHAGDPERLSIRASFPRFVDLEARYGSLIRGLWSATPPPQAGSSAFYSLAGGLGELVDTLASRLAPGAIDKDTEVASLERAEDGSFRITTGAESMSARAVIVALPPSRAAALIRGLSASLGQGLGGIRASSTATVCLGFRREDVANALLGYGLLVPASEGLRTTACSFFSTKFPGRAPAGCVLLRGFVGSPRDPRILDEDDPALAALVVREMTPVLGLRGAPVLARVFRWPAGTPQLEVGHLDLVAAMDRTLRAVPGLFLAGAGVRVTGIPDSIAQGTAAAAAAAAFLEASTLIS
jgi:protoporphyrinogen/coproporphyrinogen III oxidase